MKKIAWLILGFAVLSPLSTRHAHASDVALNPQRLQYFESYACGYITSVWEAGRASGSVFIRFTDDLSALLKKQKRAGAAKKKALAKKIKKLRKLMQSAASSCAALPPPPPLFHSKLPGVWVNYWRNYDLTTGAKYLSLLDNGSYYWGIPKDTSLSPMAVNCADPGWQCGVYSSSEGAREQVSLTLGEKTSVAAVSLSPEGDPAKIAFESGDVYYRMFPVTAQFGASVEWSYNYSSNFGSTSKNDRFFIKADGSYLEIWEWMYMGEYSSDQGSERYSGRYQLEPYFLTLIPNNGKQSRQRMMILDWNGNGLFDGGDLSGGPAMTLNEDWYWPIRD